MIRGQVIIPAAGQGLRWDNYLGVPKHLIEIDEETLIHRTTRMFLERGFDVAIVAHDDRYRHRCASFYIPTTNPEWFELSKYMDSRPLWNAEGRTIVLFGDVYFEESAANLIAEYSTRDWRAFGRVGGNPETGAEYGELFGCSFWPEQIPAHRMALDRVLANRRAGSISRCSGWEHYRAMCGNENLVDHLPGHLLIEVYGRTDDFDFPEDYDRWMASRSAPTDDPASDHADGSDPRGSPQGAGTPLLPGGGVQPDSPDRTQPDPD